MDREQATKIKLLSMCTFLPGSKEKRFVQDMKFVAAEVESSPHLDISTSQSQFLDSLYWRYRNQIKAIHPSTLAYAKIDALPEFVNPMPQKA